MKRTSNFKLLIFFLLTLLQCGMVLAQKKQAKADNRKWEKIGEKTVDFLRDRDEIKVDGKEHYSHIKFVVTDAPIYLNNMVISYETGNDQAVTINHSIKKPGESKVVEVVRPVREIRKIFFVYKTLANQQDKKAHVEIYGCKINTGQKSMTATSVPDATTGPVLVLSDKTGWHNIGSRTLDLLIGRDEITVLGADRFAIIKFRVTEGAVNLTDVEFQFESGDAQQVMMGHPLIAGTESANLNLNGGERSLKKIIFNYKAVEGQKENSSEIEVWGYKSNPDQSVRVEK